MLEGKKCELCNEIIKCTKSQYKQTKYCRECAKQKKKENTSDSWLPEERKEYMRSYMREYRRRNPKLSNPYVIRHRQKKRNVKSAVTGSKTFLCLWFVPFMLLAAPSAETVSLWFDTFKTAVSYLELLIIKLSGLIILVIICWQHIRYLFHKTDKNPKLDEKQKQEDVQEEDKQEEQEKDK